MLTLLEAFWEATLNVKTKGRSNFADPLGKHWVAWAISLRDEGAIRAATGFVDAGNAWNDLLVLRSGGASEADWDLACERLASACKRVKPGAGRSEGTHGTEFGPAAIWMSAWRCVQQAA